MKPDDEVLGPDPMLVHYREENERLRNANEELAEKVRDLEEGLAERDCCDDPCGKMKHARQRIAALKDRFAAEKKQCVVPIEITPARGAVSSAAVRERVSGSNARVTPARD